MSDVKSTYLTATGQISAAGQPARLLAVQYVSGASAGTLVFKNASGGATLLTIATPAGVAVTDTVTLPGDGIRFSTDCHLTITNTAAATCFWEG